MLQSGRSYDAWTVRDGVPGAPSSFLLLVAMPGAPLVASLLLVVRPGAPSGVLAPSRSPSSVLAPSSDARSPARSVLAPSCKARSP